MILEELKLEAISNKTQIIIFEEDGSIIDSDDSLVIVKNSPKSIFGEAIFRGLENLFSNLSLQEKKYFDCIETEFFGRRSYYDFLISRIDSKADKKRYSLVIYDLNDQYKKILELRQERNDAEIYAYQLKVAHEKLDMALKNEKEITDKLKKTQSQLVQNERMASIGQLASGIGHEINNPLNFIYNGLKLLENKLNLHFQTNENQRTEPETQATEIQHLINIMETGALRIKSVVKDLQLFTSTNENLFKDSDIHESIDATLSLVKHKKNDLEFKTHYDQRINTIHCNPGKINQVLMNLFLNAIYFIPKSRRGYVEVFTEKKNSYVLIKIKDNGIGISSTIEKNIFDPFFTTKEVGEGKGLGLSISHQIIEEHDGKLSFTSQEGKGSEFLVQLPLEAKFDKKSDPI